jgi:hypothetical protein
MLERGLRASGCRPHDARIRGCSATIARHKRGNRCTVVYTLTFHGRDGAGWPARVAAKAYRGSAGLLAYQAMCALWGSPLRDDPAVAIAEPLGYVDDLRVVLQGPVSGDVTLKDALGREFADGLDNGVVGPLHATARGLAALHACGVAAHAVTWEDTVADVRARAAGLAPWAHGLRAAMDHALDRLEALAAQRPADPPVPSHGSFRPMQVLLQGGDVAFIDFDGLCVAEPSMDVGLFISSVKSLGARRMGAAGRIDRLENLCDGFVAEYERWAPISRDRLALWEAMYLLVNVLNCWEKVRPDGLGDALNALDRHLRRTGLPPM